MTLNQFFEKLSRMKVEWRFHNNGVAIRTRSGQCPLEKMAGFHSGTEIAAGRSLGLSSVASCAIVRAADDRYSPFRNRLLRAIRLAERD